MLHLLQDVSSRLLPLDKLLQIIFTGLEVRRSLPELGPLHQVITSGLDSGFALKLLVDFRGNFYLLS